MAQTCTAALRAGTEVIKREQTNPSSKFKPAFLFMTWGLKLGRELAQTGCCLGYIWESWRPFEGEGAEAAGGAALGAFHCPTFLVWPSAAQEPG